MITWGKIFMPIILLETALWKSKFIFPMLEISFFLTTICKGEKEMTIVWAMCHFTEKRKGARIFNLSMFTELLNYRIKIYT